MIYKIGPSEVFYPETLLDSILLPSCLGVRLFRSAVETPLHSTETQET